MAEHSAITLLESWLQQDDGYDTTAWPEIRAALEGSLDGADDLRRQLAENQAREQALAPAIRALVGAARATATQINADGQLCWCPADTLRTTHTVGCTRAREALAAPALQPFGAAEEES